MMNRNHGFGTFENRISNGQSTRLFHVEILMAHKNAFSDMSKWRLFVFCELCRIISIGSNYGFVGGLRVHEHDEVSIFDSDECRFGRFLLLDLDLLFVSAAKTFTRFPFRCLKTIRTLPR
jgi:hypothetical protein